MQGRTRGRPADPIGQAVYPLMDAVGDCASAEPALRALALTGHPGAFTALVHTRLAGRHAAAASAAIETTRPRAA